MCVSLCLRQRVTGQCPVAVRRADKEGPQPLHAWGLHGGITREEIDNLCVLGSGASVVRVDECVPLRLRRRVPDQCPVGVCGVGEAGLVAVDKEVHNLCVRGGIWACTYMRQ